VLFLSETKAREAARNIRDPISTIHWRSAAVVSPHAATETHDELMAFSIVMPVDTIRAGTMGNLPPMSKNPESDPTSGLNPTSFSNFSLDNLTNGSPL
jgi:hypothetical protein